MTPCKSHQRQIALLSVQALSENESAIVREHVRECAACRAYAKQLEGIVALYTEAAERPITASATAPPHFEAQPVPWFQRLFASPAPAMAALIILGAALLLMYDRRKPDLPTPAVASVAPVVPTIANLRHLTSADLEQLAQPEPARSSSRSELVLSVKMRDDGS